jgi:hypothetical protein
MAAVLVTLQQGKDHLRIPTAAGDPGDVDIQLKLDQAEAIVLDYLKRPTPETWDASTVPGMVTASILLVLSDLFEHRDDLKPSTDTWLAVERLCMRQRDPALA